MKSEMTKEQPQEMDEVQFVLLKIAIFVSEDH